MEKASFFKTYRPLFLILLSILAVDLGWQWFQMSSITLQESLRLFMGLFFIVFALFKLLDLKGFVMAYREYDVLAKRSRFYAYLYPFIELGLGLFILSNLRPVLANILTIIIMGFSSIGVLQAVLGKRKIHCACLGAVIKLPMSTVTVIEDLGMVVMAIVMLIFV